MKQLGVWLLISLAMFICFLTLCALLIPILPAKADYEGPTVKTNINKQTDLFETSIDDHKGLEKQLEQDKAAAVSGLNQNPQGLEYISDKSASNINSEVSELKSIKASELNGKGREAFFRGNDDVDLEALYPDYSKPLNIKHKEDADKIAESTDDLLANLLGKLKDIGVDCKTVKGDKIMEPEYTIKIEQETTRKKGETLYEKAVCEEPRREYNCTDTVTLKCLKKAMKWDQWETKSIDIRGSELVANWKWVFYSKKIKKGHFRLLIYSNNDAVRKLFRSVIAEKLAVSIEQVSTDHYWVENLDYYVDPYRRAWGGVSSGRAKEYMFPTYRIFFSFRTGDEICAQWSEDWTERCKIR